MGREGGVGGTKLASIIFYSFLLILVFLFVKA